VLYELHCQGPRGVDERWEWNPELLKLRAQIEDVFEDTLRRQTQVPVGVGPQAEDVAGSLLALAAKGTGPGLSAYIAKRATKEADPHTRAIAQRAGALKAALVEIQADEYGGGDPDLMHSAIFGRTMRGLGLDDTYGAYVGLAPALTLER